MTGDCHVQFGERLVGKFRRPTHLDITLDYKAFGESIRGDESRTEIDKLNDRLKGFVLEHTRDKIKPYFENVLSELSNNRQGKVELDETGEKLYVYYPSVLGEDSKRYVPTSVLLEFGGRNINEPNEQKKITPYISANLREYKFPEPTVTVLAFMRTYWEKITLAHVECNRQKPRSDASRLSRHWYDIYQMSMGLTESQIADSLNLLADVVRHKKVFFNSSYANYDACLAGGLRIVPATGPAKVLESDFKAMIEAGMFYADPPPFKAILVRLGEVEHLLNKTISMRGRDI